MISNSLEKRHVADTNQRGRAKGVKAKVVLGVLGAAVPGAASARGFLDPAGPIASAQLSHFGVIAALTLIVIVPMFIALPIVLIRYRRGGKGTYRPDWEFSWGAELLLWGVPVVIVVMLGTALWNHTLKFDPYKTLGPEPLVVEVVTLDWKFLFLYPEQGVGTLDLLALPEGRPVTLKLTSGTVMQSFIVPRLAGQIYTMAGMQTQLNLLADESGDFIGRNTQYNGLGFANQSFTTRVMSREDFEGWVASTKAQGAPLDFAGYETLLKPSRVEQPVLYGSVAPGLFDQVIASFAPLMAAGHGHMHGSAPGSTHQSEHPMPEAGQ